MGYRCTNSAYDDGSAVYADVHEFCQMCLECFGDIPAMVKRGRAYFVDGVMTLVTEEDYAA